MIGVVVALNGAAAAERKRRNIRRWRLTHVRVRGVIAARMISTWLGVRVGLDVITTAGTSLEVFCTRRLQVDMACQIRDLFHRSEGAYSQLLISITALVNPKTLTPTPGQGRVCLFAVFCTSQCNSQLAMMGDNMLWNGTVFTAMQLLETLKATARRATALEVNFHPTG